MFMNPSALPETVDFGGPAAEIFFRQAQVRWTQPFQWGNFAAYRHFWTDTWRSTLSYSYGEADNNVDIVGTAVNKKFQSVHGNIIRSPIPAVNLGVEYIWGYRELENGLDGDLNRIQFGAQYKFF